MAITKENIITIISEALDSDEAITDESSMDNYQYPMELDLPIMEEYWKSNLNITNVQEFSAFFQFENKTPLVEIYISFLLYFVWLDS